MNEELVKNSVMNANVDPKVVMDLSKFQIAGWIMFQPSNVKLLQEFIDETVTWLLIGIPKRGPFFCDTTLGETLCEFGSTHEEIDVHSWRSSCDDAMIEATAFCWLLSVAWTSKRIHTMERTFEEEIGKRINHILNTRTSVQVEHWGIAKRIHTNTREKKRSVNTNSWRSKISLESFFCWACTGSSAQNWMNLEMQATLLNTFRLKLIATILKTLRAQLKEND